MQAQIKAAREKRASLHDQAKALIIKVNDDKLSDTARAEARTEFDKINAEIETKTADIKRMEAHVAVENAVSAQVDELADTTGRPRGAVEEEEGRRFEVFRAYLLGGPQALTPEQAEIYRNDMSASLSNLPRAAQSVGTPTAGGITVPTTTLAAIEAARKAFGGVYAHATVLTTGSGEKIIMPTSNDTAEEGEWLAENAEATAQDVAFSNIELESHIHSSKVIRVPYTLLQDSAVDIEAFLASRIGERYARGSASAYVTGDGSGKPKGIVTASPKGVDAGAAAAITYADLVKLEHSVDPAYRRNGRFGFSDGTELKLKLMVDNEGRPLWQPGIAVGSPDTIDGKPYEVCYGMAEVGASAKSVIFGDFSKYFIRNVAGTIMFRLQELYATFMQVGLLAFNRTDGELMDAGVGPVKHLLHPAS